MARRLVSVALVGQGSGALLVLAAACSSFSGGSSPAAPDAEPDAVISVPEVGPPEDARSEPRSETCRDRKFGMPTQVMVPGIGAPQSYRPLLRAEGSFAFGTGVNGPVFGMAADIEGAPVMLDKVDLLASVALNAVANPIATSDGKVLYIQGRVTNLDALRIWRVSRAGLDQGFASPLEEKQLEPDSVLVEPWLVDGDLTMYFAGYPSLTNVNRTLYRASRSAITEGFSGAEPLTDIKRSPIDGNPVVPGDELEIYFATSIGGGTRHIFRSTRADKNAKWSQPVAVPELSSPFDERPTWISKDGCTMYLIRNGGDAAASTAELYRAVRAK